MSILEATLQELARAMAFFFMDFFNVSFSVANNYAGIAVFSVVVLFTVLLVAGIVSWCCENY